MSTKPKAARSESRQQSIEVKGNQENLPKLIAHSVLRPAVKSGLLVNAYRVTSDELDLREVVDELSKQCQAVSDGKMNRPEAMLTAQAHSLDAIFTNLASLAKRNLTNNFEVFERLMRLALKTQSQCRTTIETLSAIKNPSVVIARQANVTSGPQQVNNGVPLARENQIEPNKLLEQSNGQWLDGGAASQAVGGDQAMAAVEAIDRSAIRRRETT